MSLAIGKLQFRARTNIAKVLKMWHTGASRNYASRKDCAEYEGPRCSKEFLEKQPPCPAKLRRMETNYKLASVNSMWENPECCIDQCPDYMPRFDELYYKTSDKLKRKYQQTWVACPNLKVKPKVVCHTEQLQFPPLEKRTSKGRPKTACPKGGAKMCMESKSIKCPMIKMFGCKGVRSPPKCKTERIPRDCKKDCAPYPSFSECLRSRPDPLHPQECKCLNHPVMCDVWAEMRRRMAFVK